MSERPASEQVLATLTAEDLAERVKDLQPPPLPVAVSRVIAEINRPDPDVERLVEVLSACPETAAKILRTINSSIFSLRHPVISVRHAAALLGMRHLRPIAVSFALAGALPRPPAEVFDHEGFWSDSLIRAMFARAFATRCCPVERETAFTGALLADLAIPVLLLAWKQAYGPIPAAWRESPRRLSEIERRKLGWDHGAAGAHIMAVWGLPRGLASMVAMHTWPVRQIRARDAGGGATIAVAAAAMIPSVQRPGAGRSGEFVRTAMSEFAISPRDMVTMIAQIRAGFEEVCHIFGIRDLRALGMLDALVAVASRQAELPAAG